MKLIDERGRLFGKLNLIDALVILVVVVMFPVAYGAYVLFRTPDATIVSIEPATITQPSTTVPLASRPVITIRGTNLRPYLRARIGTTFTPFLIETPGIAEVKLPELPPGTYDFALFDEAEQIAIEPGALTILPPSRPPVESPPPPPPQLRFAVQVVGVFVGLARGDLRGIHAGSVFEDVARVLTVGAAEPGAQQIKFGANMVAAVPLANEFRLPAVIRVRCTVGNGECRVGQTAVGPNATILLSAESRQFSFLIDDVRPASAPAVLPATKPAVAPMAATMAVATVQVRFVAVPAVLSAMQVGDIDISGVTKVADSDRAELTAIGSERQTLTADTLIASPAGQVKISQPVVAVTGTVRVPVVSGPSGWTYLEHPVRIGTTFVFETPAGSMTGPILDMKLSDAKRPKR